MNIGVNIRYIIGEATGIGRYTKCILDELQRIDLENNYYLIEYARSDYELTNPKWKIIPQHSKIPGSLWLQTAVPKMITKYNIDLFWSPEILSPIFGVPKNVKIVTTVHDLLFLRYPKIYGTLLTVKNKIMFAQSLKKSAALIPVSDYIKNELLQFYPALQSASKTIRTISNAAKDHSYDNKRIERENFLFFPGNLDPRKNFFRLIKALEIVNASGMNIDLHLCGPVRWKNTELTKLLQDSPIKNRIKHLGYITDEELINQYLSCKAVIFPSIYEGFGLPILEALKLNTPVLTSKGTVMEEIAGENAMYFNPYDVNSIADTIIQFLKSGAIPINMESLKKYSWKQSAKNLLSVFEDSNQS